MPKSATCLFIGSTEAYSGKSATVLGIASQLQHKGLKFCYGKPLGTYLEDSSEDEAQQDVQMMADVLNLSAHQWRSPLVSLSPIAIAKRLNGDDSQDYAQLLRDQFQMPNVDLVLLEGPSNLEEGRLLNLSLAQMAQVMDAFVVLVARYHPVSLLDQLLFAKQQLGDRLIGTVINDIPANQWEDVQVVVQPFLTAQGIDVLGMLPHSDVLRSVSVRELVHRLNAEVLCCPERLELMVESLTIGAMNVNSALKYFRRGRKMAVVTGGDRTDLQLAALETDTHCLILTGHLAPDPRILSRAEDLEIPILSVDLDTLTTVEIIDHAFGQVRLHETIKVQQVFQLMEEHVNVDRLIERIGLAAAISA